MAKSQSKYTKYFDICFIAGANFVKFCIKVGVK